MKKIYLTLIMGILIISFISSIYFSQEITLSDTDKAEGILNYSLKWSEIDNVSKEGCYVLLKEDDNPEQIQSNWDISYCENKKIIEIMFNTVQELKLEIDLLRFDNNLMKESLCKLGEIQWC